MASKKVTKLAPHNKQRPGGDAGPGSKINSFNLLSVSGTKLMAGASSSRGKGMK